MSLIPEFKDLPSYHVYGYAWIGSDNSEIPALWQLLEEKFAPVVGHVLPERTYGIGSEFQPDGTFMYTIAMDYKDGMPIPDGFFIHKIPAGHYAVFIVPMDAIGLAFTHIYGQWLPVSGWKHRGTPDIEVYEMNSSSPYSMQILIPVEQDI